MSLLVKLWVFWWNIVFFTKFSWASLRHGLVIIRPLSLSYSMEQLSAYGDRDQPAPRADQDSRKDKTANMSVSSPPDSSEDGDMAPPTSVPAGPTGPVTCDPELSIPASLPVLPGSQGPVGVHPVPPPPDEPYEMYLCRIERHKTDSTSLVPQPATAAPPQELVTLPTAHPQSFPTFEGPVLAPRAPSSTPRMRMPLPGHY